MLIVKAIAECFELSVFQQFVFCVSHGLAFR
jgi:hypothetical protein